MADTYQDKVITFDRAQGMALADNSIDESSGTIKGVSLATAGVEAIGHGEVLEDGTYREFWTDETTLQDMLTAIELIGEPLKAKLEHGTGLDAIVGEFDNFRIEGEHLRADFTAYPTSQYKDHLFTLAKRLSKQFGISVTAMLRKVKQGAVDLMRCDEILSADFVDEPAINAALFSRKNRLDKNNPVSKKSLQMEKEEMQSALEEALKPITERLSKLESGNEPDEEKLAAKAKEKEEMASKLDAASAELAKVNGKLTELENENKALGLKVGAIAQPEKKEDATFEGELSKIIESGTPKHLAVSVLCTKNPELAKAEAKKRGCHTWQLTV